MESTPVAGLIHKLIPEAMGRIGAIGKNKKNVQQNYQFRGIDDLYYAVQPVFKELGIFVVPSVLTQTREKKTTKSGGEMTYTILTVKHTFYAPDGSSVEAVTIGEASDSGDKSANKAMSAAMKYALIEVFSIPTDEPIDTENDSPEFVSSAKTQRPAQPSPQQTVDANAKASKQQADEAIALVASSGISDEMLKTWFSHAKVEAWQDMKATSIQACISYMKKLEIKKSLPKAA